MSLDHYKMTGPALISFSGGRTSGFMLHNILEANGGLPKDVHVVFNKHTGAHYNAWPHEKVCPASLPDTDHVGACDICKWCFT